MAAAKDNEAEEELHMISVRVPKSLKKRLQRAAIDDDSSSQVIIRRAVEAELDRMGAPPASRWQRR